MKLKSETLLNLGLTALLAFSAAYLISSVALLKAKPCLAPVKVNLSKESEKRWKLPYSLEKEGFFSSKGAKKAEEKPAEKEEVVESIGEYSLKGTVVCSKCGHSVAILKNREGKSLVVAEGEEVGGYRLKRVLPQQTVFEKGGKEFILKLEEKKEETSSTAYQTPQTQRFTVKKKEVIEEISSGEFLKYINIVPTKNPEGLKVNYVNPRSFVYKLGIRPGDVILSINDVRIKTPEDSFSAFERLKNADTVTITVLRRGKEVKLHYELQ